MVEAYVGQLPTGPAFGADAYAGARPNTATFINTTSVHQRAQMIVALRRWIRAVAPFALDPRVPVNARRLAYASLVTDIVALGDSIYTRVAAGPTSADALDRLVERPGTDVLAQWDATTNVRAMLAALRDCRNTVAAHLEVDPSVGLAQLLARLDGIEPQRALRTFDRVAGLFHQICMAEDYLNSYLSDGTPMRGVLSVSHGGVHRPYDPARSQSVGELEVRRVDATDAAAIDAAIDEWCATGDDELRSALWNLSDDGPVLEVVEASARRIELRLFHERFASKVATSDADGFARMMELAASLGSGSPIPLVEALLRGVEARDADIPLRALAAGALSRIPLRAGESPRVDRFLQELLQHDLAVAHAVLALYQLENVTVPTAAPIVERVLASLGDRGLVDRAIAIGALISRVWSGRTYRDPSAVEVDAEVLVEAAGGLLPAETPPRVTMQTKKLARGDAIGFLLTIAEELPFDPSTRERIYRTAISPALALPRDVCLRRSARMNRATALHRLGMIEHARALCVEVLQSSDYSRPSSCVGAVEHAAACGVDPRKSVAVIREACVLAPDELARLGALAP